jgi:hypothetical protein
MLIYSGKLRFFLPSEAPDPGLSETNTHFIYRHYIVFVHNVVNLRHCEEA